MSAAEQAQQKVLAEQMRRGVKGLCERCAYPHGYDDWRPYDIRDGVCERCEGYLAVDLDPQAKP